MVEKVKRFDNKLMRINLDGNVFQLQGHGGISRIYTEILPRICELDETINFQVFCDLYYGGLQQSLPAHEQITSIFIPSYRSNLLQKIFNRVRRKLWLQSNTDFRETDIWHSTYFTPPPSKKLRHVTTIYDMISEIFEDDYLFLSFQKRVKKTSIQSADAIITISNATKTDLCSYYSVNENRIFPIPLAASPIFRQLNKNEVNIPKQIPSTFILYVGNRRYYKNFERLLEAYKRWKYKDDLAFVVVGPEWEETELSIIRDENIALLTDVSDELLVSLYNSAQLFIYPSLYEGFGIPILEAMSCGCPIAISDIAVHREVAGNAALYFDPYDIANIEDILSRGIEAGRASQNVQMGLIRCQDFTWDKTAQKTLEVYQQFQ